MLLVIAVIYLFLGSWRAALIPAVTILVCIVATFIGPMPSAFRST